MERVSDGLHLCPVRPAGKLFPGLEAGIEGWSTVVGSLGSVLGQGDCRGGYPPRQVSYSKRVTCSRPLLAASPPALALGAQPSTDMNRW
jgi:hypothetical protein